MAIIDNFLSVLESKGIRSRKDKFLNRLTYHPMTEVGEISLSFEHLDGRDSITIKSTCPFEVEVDEMNEAILAANYLNINFLIGKFYVFPAKNEITFEMSFEMYGLPDLELGAESLDLLIDISITTMAGAMPPLYAIAIEKKGIERFFELCDDIESENWKPNGV